MILTCMRILVLRPRNGASMAVNGELSEERKAEEAGDELRKALEVYGIQEYSQFVILAAFAENATCMFQARPITFVLTRNRAPGHWPIPEAFWPDAVQ